ncbi:MAG: hypothetical protein KC449_08345 [Anaerolineales bacterium]|nr:hypothetical protein [Anaerolineales bacterium]
MSQNGNFVIIQNEIVEGYFDKWGALGCLHTFALGPNKAAEVARKFAKTETLDAIFAEGGYLLDFDRKQAIVFGYPDIDDEFGDDGKQISEVFSSGELAYLQYIAPLWPGWKLTWNYQGAEAFANYLTDQGIGNFKLLPRSQPINESPISFQA